MPWHQISIGCNCWQGSVTIFVGSEGLSLWGVCLRKHHIAQLLSNVRHSLCRHGEKQDKDIDHGTAGAAQKQSSDDVEASLTH